MRIAMKLTVLSAWLFLVSTILTGSAYSYEQDPPFRQLSQALLAEDKKAAPFIFNQSNALFEPAVDEQDKARFEAALVEQEKRNFDKAIEIYKELLNSHPGFAPAHYNCGLCLEEQNKWEPALERFLLATRANPLEKSTRRHLIFLYQKLGQQQQAQAEYRTLQTL